MTFDEMESAISDAKQKLYMARRCAEKLVELLVGNLRASNASGYNLTKLKRELRDWDMRSHSWRQT